MQRQATLRTQNPRTVPRSARPVSLRLPILFTLVALLPLAVLTQAPLAKPIEPDPHSPETFATWTSGPFDEDEVFDAYAPLQIVKAFTFSSMEQWDASTFRLNIAGEATPQPADFVSHADESPPATALFALRALPDQQTYVDWLSARLTEIVAEKQAATSGAPLVTFVMPEPEPRHAGIRAIDAVPMYEVWVSLLRDQPRPKRADEFIVRIKRIFAEEGVPEELAWLPEVESMFDPRARNRIGARGLFQFMPGTALEQGLRLRPHDERVHPEKSARAAAVLLRRLHEVFDSWPLALAAYNAGESRVRRTLDARDATTFAEIAHALPAETRLYVPRVLATLAVREGYDPALLAAPRVAAVD